MRYCRQNTAQLYTCAPELFVLLPSQLRNGCWNLGNFPPQFCPGFKIKPFRFLLLTQKPVKVFLSQHITASYWWGKFWWDIVCLRAGCRKKPWSTPFLPAVQKRPLALVLSSPAEAFADQRWSCLAPQLPDTPSCCSALPDCRFCPGGTLHHSSLPFSHPPRCVPAVTSQPGELQPWLLHVLLAITDPGSFFLYRFCSLWFKSHSTRHLILIYTC